MKTWRCCRSEVYEDRTGDGRNGSPLEVGMFERGWQPRSSNGWFFFSSDPILCYRSPTHSIHRSTAFAADLGLELQPHPVRASFTLSTIKTALASADSIWSKPMSGFSKICSWRFIATLQQGTAYPQEVTERTFYEGNLLYSSTFHLLKRTFYSYTGGFHRSVER